MSGYLSDIKKALTVCWQTKRLERPSFHNLNTNHKVSKDCVSSSTKSAPVVSVSLNPRHPVSSVDRNCNEMKSITARTIRETEKAILRQLEEEGILSTRRQGGVSFYVPAAECKQLTVRPQLVGKSGHSPQLSYSLDEKIKMADIIREEQIAARKNKAHRVYEKRMNVMNKRKRKEAEKQARLRMIDDRMQAVEKRAKLIRREQKLRLLDEKMAIAEKKVKNAKKSHKLHNKVGPQVEVCGQGKPCPSQC